MRPELKRAVLVVAVLAIVGCVLVMPSESDAQEVPTQDGAVVSVNDGTMTRYYDTFSDVFTATSGMEQATVTLLAPITSATTWTIASGDIMLDLNGQTLTLTKDTIVVDGKNRTTFGRINVSAADASLKIVDGSADSDGVITGTIGQMIQTSGTLMLESGSIESSAYGAVRINSEGTFEMTGGNVSGTTESGVAIQALSGTTNLYGGTINGESTKYAAVECSGSAVTIGETIGGTGPTIDSIDPNNYVVTINCGYIGEVKGDFADGSSYNADFGTDISDHLTVNLVSVPYTDDSGQTVYRVETLTSDTAAAIINGDQLYGSVISAFSAMTNGDTLVIKRDFYGTTSLSAGIYEGTIDLDGHIVTVTNDNAYGISINPNSAVTWTEGSSVTIQNGTISASRPIYAGSGGSGLMTLIVEDDLTLTGFSGDPLTFGSNVCVPDTERMHGYITTGGFTSTHADGGYIHSDMASAVRNDVDGKSTLLHDYTGNLAISTPDGNFTLDLGGNTVTGLGPNATINITADKTTLTIKNGTIDSPCDGAWVGQNTSNGANTGVTLVLQDITLNADGSFGIYSNGYCTDVRVEIVDSEINCVNQITDEEGTTSGSLGVYFPCRGTLVIENSQIHGYTGIEMRGGSIEIYGEDTVISGQGEIRTRPSENSGSGVDGAGLVINPYNDRTASATIYNGKIVGTVGLYEATYQEGSEPSSVSIAMYGGTVESNNTDPDATTYGPIYTDDLEITNFVYGGTISGYEAATHSKYVASTSSVDESSGAVTPDTSQDDAVAQVDGICYDDLDLAVQMAKSSGQELILLKTVTVVNGESLSIDRIIISMGDGLTGPMFTTYVDSTLTLTNVTMTGNDSGNEMISVGNGTVVLTSCIMKDNQFSAITVNNGTLEMHDTIVSEMNYSDGYNGLGGAINSMHGTITIEGCTFENNIASENGGAIYADSGTLTISDTIFTGNSARVGGAIGLQSNFDDLTVSLDGLTITDNTATDMGGAIHAMVTRQDLADGSSWEYTISMTLKDSIIEGDSNISPYNGQAITLYKYNTDADITLTLSGTCGIDGTVSALKYQENDFVYGSPKYVVEEGFGLAEGYSPISLAYLVSPDNGTTIVSGDGADVSLFSLYGQDQIFYENADGELVVSHYVTVTFEMYDGDVQTQVIAGDAITYPTSDREGFSVSGWLNNGVAWDMSSSTDRDIILTPVWAFIADGAEATIDASQGDTDVILTAGYKGTFDGVTESYSWSDGSAINTTHISADGTYTVTITLTDSYSSGVTPLTLTQSITVDGNIVRFMSDGEPVRTLYVLDGTNISEEDYPVLTKDGYLLLEWDGNTSNITDDVDVTAVWMKIYEVSISFSGPLYQGDSITATVNVAGVESGYTALYMFGLEDGPAPDPLPQSTYTVSEDGSYLAIVMIYDGDTMVGIGGSEIYSIEYSERPVDPTPDPPIIPGDDDYVPVPPTIVIDGSSSDDDEAVKVAACAAAAVAAAIIACLIIMENRRN